MPMISISPPCTKEKWKEIKNKGPIVRPNKFVARANPHGPYGYGDTAEEACKELIRILHDEINNNTAACLFNERGTMPEPFEFVPVKYVPEDKDGA